jgi:RNA polymerase-binding protein DksA
MALTDDQIRTLRDQLDKRFYELREEISRELRSYDDATYIELAGQVQDPGDMSVADLLEDIQLADVDRHVEEIRAIDAAMLRIAEGRYGTCIDCGKPIGFERLQAQATALRCEPCQERHEEKTAVESPSL